MRSEVIHVGPPVGSLDGEAESGRPDAASIREPRGVALRQRGRGRLAEELAVIGVLFRRDLLLFVRQRSRVLGTLAQPLIFWLVIGSGMESTFRLPGASNVGYLEYFFPGIVLMIVLFTAIFATTSVIEDRHAGFLQGVLVAPGSRGALVLGKSFGSSSVAMLQAVLLCAAAPFAGFHLGTIAWGLLLGALALSTVGLVALGFTMAWWLDSSQAYHVVMSVLLLPLWVLSGAMFPPSPDHPVIRAVMLVNPMTYAVDAIRAALYGGVAPAGTAFAAPAVALGALLGFMIAFLALAMLVCQRRR